MAAVRQNSMRRLRTNILSSRSSPFRSTCIKGAGTCVFWTTDLTTQYIHINADYST